MELEDIENPIVDILTSEEENPQWLVPNLWLQGTMVCLAGEPGAGKSLLCMAIGMAIASGSPALSGLVPAGEPKRVLYFDNENSSQDRNKYLRRAFQGLTRANKKEPDLGMLHTNFWVAADVLGTEDWEAVAGEYVQAIKPHAIFFDTATPCLNIGDENSNAEANQGIKGIKRLMNLTDPVATAIPIKHAKIRTEKGGRRTMRGAKHWQGAADQVQFQVKAAGRPRKDGLSLTRLEPDKVRAWGLPSTLYISPTWTNDKKSGLILAGSYTADKDHRKAEKDDDIGLAEPK